MPAAHDEDEFREWLNSAEGQHPIKAADTVHGLLEDVGLDIGPRLFLWPDGQARTFEESLTHIHHQVPQVSAAEAAPVVIDWMEEPQRLQESARGEVSGASLQELEDALDAWIRELDQPSAPS
jgi:hypothetical protein